jgi:NAD(P)-dependent dehydrogenase (short-subunit alcohol dehydrogenase family)
MPSLADKIAIVTGASRGIGRAIAIRLALDGAKVVLTARDAGLLESVVSEIKAAGGSAASVAFDLREPDAPAQLAQFAQAQFGSIDIVVNNAGATKRGDFLTLTEEDWKDGYALKFFGAMRLTRAVWPQLKARRGSVVNIAGVGGRTPGAQFTIGGSVNAALLSLTKALSELGIQDGVQVNAINPGPVRTDRLQARLKILAREKEIDPADAEAAMVHEMRITRVGEPEDIASLVAYLVSPESRLIHGAFIDIDGGETKTL